MATLYDGQRSTFTDTTPQVRVITDLISLITPRDTPLIARFGVKNSPPPGWKIMGWPGYKIEWLEDELVSMVDALDGSITSTATTITVTDASVFHVGDRLLVDAEEMRVSARNTTSEVLTVTRGYTDGSTAATHADAATVKIIGNAQGEGLDSNEGSTVDITSNYNIVQTFEDQVRITDLEQIISQYGISDSMEYQVEKKVQENLKKLEQNLYLGGRDDGAVGSARAMGSLDYFINQTGGNIVSAGGAVTQADFEDALELAYADGGNPRVALCSPANMQVIKNFYDSSSFLRVERTEETVGMTINMVHTPFGDVELLMSRYQPTSSIPIIDPDHYSGPLAIEPWKREILARTGRYNKVMLSGVFTHLVRHGTKAHAIITNIS